MVRLAAHVALGFALAACGNAPAGSTCSAEPRGPTVDWFSDVTGESGIDVEFATTGFKGGALVVSDLDGDDLPDIVAANRTGPTQVYRNRGAMRFDERSDSGIDPSAGATSAAAVDLDNDGDRDLVLASSGTAVVYANAGDGTFTVAARLEDSGFTEHVLALDVDRDGLLDLYFSNYDVQGGSTSEDRIYMQRGSLAFTGGRIPGADLSWTAGALDIDGDGDLDLHVANDALVADHGVPPERAPFWPGDKLLRNDGLDADGQPIFTDVAADAGLATPRSSMSSIVGDLDEDGELDLLVTDWGPNKLFAQRGAAFVDTAAPLGLDPAARENDYCAMNPTADECLLFSWSAVAADFDHDGHDEVLVVNGGNGGRDVAPVQLFTRGADAVFSERSADMSCTDGRSVVAADLDGDGDEDVVIAPVRGPLALYETRGAPASVDAWVDIRLHGTASNRDGIGSVLRLTLASGRTLARAVGVSGVVHTAGSITTHLSLGEDAVTRVDVQWPSGRTSTIEGPRTGRVVLDEP